MLFYVVLYIALLFLLFYKSKFFIKIANAQFMDKESTGSLKAFCAWGVVFHHIANEIECGKMLYPFRPIGFMLVAVFFFFSGFGLIVSKNKKTSYLNTFFKNRILYILLPYTLALIVHFIYYSFFGGVHYINILEQFMGGTPFVRNSWFIIVLLYLYLLFWFCFKFIKNRVLSNVVFYAFLGSISLLRFIPHWNPSVIAFLFGCVFADKYETLSRAILKHNWMFGFISFALTGALFFIKLTASAQFESYINIAISISFVCVIIFMLTRIRMSNKLLSLSSKILFEIYLYHEMVMLLLNNFDFLTSNPPIYIVLTIVFTLLISVIAHYIKSFISLRLVKQ